MLIGLDCVPLRSHTACAPLRPLGFSHGLRSLALPCARLGSLAPPVCSCALTHILSVSLKEFRFLQ